MFHVKQTMVEDWTPDAEQWVGVYEVTADQTVTLLDPWQEYCAAIERQNNVKVPACTIAATPEA